MLVGEIAPTPGRRRWQALTTPTPRPPGPGSYDPVNPGSRNTNSAVPFPVKLRPATAGNSGTPGPGLYNLHGAMQSQVSGFAKPTAPAYSFGSGRDSLSVGMQVRVELLSYGCTKTHSINLVGSGGPNRASRALRSMNHGNDSALSF